MNQPHPGRAACAGLAVAPWRTGRRGALWKPISFRCTLLGSHPKALGLTVFSWAPASPPQSRCLRDVLHRCIPPEGKRLPQQCVRLETAPAVRTGAPAPWPPSVPPWAAGGLRVTIRTEVARSWSLRTDSSVFPEAALYPPVKGKLTQEGSFLWKRVRCPLARAGLCWLQQPSLLENEGRSACCLVVAGGQALGLSRSPASAWGRHRGAAGPAHYCQTRLWVVGSTV